MADPTTNALRANLQNAAIALVLIHVVGTLGYYLIAEGKATVFDAFYMTFITVATIGYAEVIDLSHVWAGRVFTVAIGLVGIGHGPVMFANFMALLLASAMVPSRQRARPIREMRKMQGHYIVCGLGRIGANVVRELQTTSHSLVAIEALHAAIDSFLVRERRSGERVLLRTASSGPTVPA